MSDHSISPSAEQTSAAARDQMNLAAGLWYLDHHLCTIPACPRDHSGPLPPIHLKECKRPGKRPPYCWKEYQERLPTPDTLRAWWARNSRLNVGILLGKVSGLVGIDVDGPEGEELLLRLSNGELPTTWEFRSGSGGRRLLYALPAGAKVVTTAEPTRKKPLHLLANGGFTVMPPSIHECGRRYEWINAPDDIFISGQLHTPSSSQIQSATCNGSHTTKVVDVATAPEWLLRKLDAGQRRFRQPGGGIQSERMVDGLGGVDVRRARAYLRKCDPAISGQGGHSQTFKVACKLVLGFSLPADLALSLMMEEWNPRCEPPWSEAELRHKVEDAARVGSCPPMHNRNGQAPAPARSRETPNEDNGPHQKEKKKVSLGARGDLVRDEPLTYRWEGRVPEATATVLQGKKSKGKTTMLAAMVADATGGPRLPGPDQERRKLGPVLIYTSEDRPGGGWKRRLAAAGADLSLIHYPDRDDNGNVKNRIKVPDDIDVLEDQIKEADASLVIIDKLSAYVPPGLSINDEQQATFIVQSLVDVAGRTGCPIIFTQHIPRRKATDPAEEGIGAVALGNTVRSILTIKDHPTEKGLRVLAVAAANDAERPRSLAFRIVGEKGAPVIDWKGEVPPDVEQQMEGSDDPADQEDKAEGRTLLPFLLQDGPMWSKELLQRAKDAGVSERTMKTWKKRYHVKSQDRMEGGVKRRYWVPPEGGFPPLE